LFGGSIEIKERRTLGVCGVGCFLEKATPRRLKIRLDDNFRARNTFLVDFQRFSTKKSSKMHFSPETTIRIESTCRSESKTVEITIFRQ
jgi:hypothetical protein